MQIEQPTDARRAERQPVAVILLADDQAAQMLGVSRRKFHELRGESWMPKPRILGPRLLRWVRSELEQAVASIPQQEQAIEPERLRRARIDRFKAGPTT